MPFFRIVPVKSFREDMKINEDFRMILSPVFSIRPEEENWMPQVASPVVISFIILKKCFLYALLDLYVF